MFPQKLKQIAIPLILLCFKMSSDELRTPKRAGVQALRESSEG